MGHGTTRNMRIGVVFSSFKDVGHRDHNFLRRLRHRNVGITIFGGVGLLFGVFVGGHGRHGVMVVSNRLTFANNIGVNSRCVGHCGHFKR